MCDPVELTLPINNTGLMMFAAQLLDFIIFFICYIC